MPKDFSRSFAVLNLIESVKIKLVIKALSYYDGSIPQRYKN
jgi:hypothetical protein